LSQRVQFFQPERYAVEAELIETTAGYTLSEGVKSGHYGYLVHSGELFVSVHYDKEGLLPGELAWIGAGQSRTITSLGPASWTVFRVRNRAFSTTSDADRIAWETLMRMGKMGPKMPLLAGTLDNVERLSRTMRAWHDRQSQLALPALKGCLLQLLALIADDSLYQQKSVAAPGLSQRFPELQQALLLIDREAVSIPDAKTLARRCGLSRSALYRLFQEAELPTPARMLEQARMEVSTRLMQDTRRTILEIALETGHQSLSAFYRSFIRTFGQSPGKWRRSKHADDQSQRNDR